MESGHRSSSYLEGMRVKRLGLALLWLAATVVPIASAQSCISLSGSSQCPAFNTSSIAAKDQTLLSAYPFLAFVSSREDFDTQLSQYVQQDYVRAKYQNILGCSNVTLSNTTSYYARYTTSVICNAIVQNSIQPCGLSASKSPPLCADTCAQQAISEEEIAVNTRLCGTPGPDFMPQIRADFTNCALPANSLSGSCINGEQNEPDECGYSTNLQGLCGYCAVSSPNSTDSCCVAANVTGRCTNVKLPNITALPPLFTSTPSSTSKPTSSPSAAAAASSSNTGLDGGAIAGIVIGSIVGAVLLLALLVFCCIWARRRRGSQRGSVFNQTTPKRSRQPSMAYAAQRDSQPPPGGRIARMTALEGNSSDGRSNVDPILAAERRKYGTTSESDNYDDPAPRTGPVTGKRNASLSSGSVLAGLGGDETSPNSNGNGGRFSSPGDVHSGQSEQLPFFKDYYSTDEIHPHDKVAVLWAYQPRANDEFELERGDMLRVTGIWDDGWATGVRVEDRADDYDGKHKMQRDSGVSQGTGARVPSPLPVGEIKAFPLVCVCLPEHWKKTVEADSSTDTNSPPPAIPGEHPSSNFGNF